MTTDTHKHRGIPDIPVDLESYSQCMSSDPFYIMNALISFCKNGGEIAPLFNAGYELAGIEVPAQGQSGGNTEIDILAFNNQNNKFVAAEAKNGSGTRPTRFRKQAQTYSNLNATQLMCTAELSPTVNRQPQAEPLYCCPETAVTPIQNAMDKHNVQHPLIGVDESGISKHSVAFVDPLLEAQFNRCANTSVTLAPYAPDRYLTIGPHSAPDVYQERVGAILFKYLSANVVFVPFSKFCQEAVPYLQQFSSSARDTIINKVRVALEEIVSCAHDTYGIGAHETNTEDNIYFYNNPAKNQPQGRTQGFQGIKRRHAKPIQKGPECGTLEEILEQDKCECE